MFFRSHSANWLTDLVNTVWLIADVMISPTIIRAPPWRGCRRQTRDTSPTTVIRLPRSDRPTVDFSRTRLMRSMLNMRGSQASRRVAKSGIDGPPYRPAIFSVACASVASAQPLGDWCSSRAANRPKATAQRSTGAPGGRP